MPFPLRIDRRTFLTRAARRRRIVTLSCERLYMKYMDASGSGRAPHFLAALERDLAAADEIWLTDREWFTRDEFRTDIEPLLRASGRHAEPIT